MADSMCRKDRTFFVRAIRPYLHLLSRYAKNALSGDFTQPTRTVPNAEVISNQFFYFGQSMTY